MTDNLPEVEYIVKQTSKTFYIDNKSEYTEFMETFASYVSSDCRALTCDGNVIYNLYKKMSIRENIQENLIRKNVIENCHSSIFVHLFRSTEPSSLILYMFGEYSWFIIVRFYPIVNCVMIEYYMSKKFQERFSYSELNS